MATISPSTRKPGGLHPVEGLVAAAGVYKRAGDVKNMSGGPKCDLAQGPKGTGIIREIQSWNNEQAAQGFGCSG